MRFVWAVVASCCVLVAACNNRASSSASAQRLESPPQGQAEALQAKMAAAPQQAASVTRKLVRKIELDLTVADTSATADALGRLAGELGGHVSELTSERRDALLYYDLTLRIPEQRTDEATGRIKTLASRVDRESVSAEDVTEQFVDLSARLKTLEATEAELRTLLSESRQRQQRAEDIMAIYRELTSIRTNIEQIRGQLNVVNDLTSLATITVRLAPAESSRPVTPGWHPLETARASVRALVALLTGIADLAIGFVVIVVPAMLAIGLAVWLAVRGWRLVSRRRA